MCHSHCCLQRVLLVNSKWFTQSTGDPSAVPWRHNFGKKKLYLSFFTKLPNLHVCVLCFHFHVFFKRLIKVLQRNVIDTDVERLHTGSLWPLNGPQSHSNQCRLRVNTVVLLRGPDGATERPWRKVGLCSWHFPSFFWQSKIEGLDWDGEVCGKLSCSRLFQGWVWTQVNHILRSYCLWKVKTEVIQYSMWTWCKKQLKSHLFKQD